MHEFISNTTVQAGLLILVLCVLIALAFYLMSNFRDYTAQDRDVVAETLANLEEMRSKGDISEAEYRNIKTTTQRQLANRIIGVESQSQNETSPPK